MRIICGHIRTYDVFITEKSVVVLDEERIVTRQQIDMSKFLKGAKEIKLGWASFADFEVIYVYDKTDDYFGYAVNLQDPSLSEWGYAPFRK
jgi:hypothetical protein